MNTKLKSTLRSTLALLINVQLVISPMALAEETKTATNTNGLVNLANLVMQGAQQGLAMMSQQGAGNPMQQLRVQAANPSTLPPALQRSGCFIPRASSDKPGKNTCDPSSLPPPNPQGIPAIDDLLLTAEKNISDYKNYSIKGNEKYEQGLRCLDNARQQLHGILSSQIEAYDKAVDQLEELIADFEEKTQASLQLIKHGDALLNGRKGDEDFKSLEDFKFGDKFKTPACASFMTDTAFGEEGDKAGYRGIEEMLEKRFNGTAPGASNSSYSPKDLIGSQGRIQRDIKKIARKIANDIKKRSNPLPGVSDSAQTNFVNRVGKIDTKIFKTNHPALQTLVQSEIQDLSNEISSKKVDLEGVSDDLMKTIESGRFSGDRLSKDYTRTYYRNCLISDKLGSIDAFLANIKNPSIRDDISRRANSKIKTKTEEYLTAIANEDMDLDEAIAKLRTYDTGGYKYANANYQSTVSCGGEEVDIKGGQFTHPAEMLKLYGCECKEDYQASSGGRPSAAKIASSIKEYGDFMKNGKNNFANSLREKIEQKLLTCTDEAEIGTASLSCNGALDKQSDSFCLRTAKVCASNVQACQKQAREAISQTRAEQKAHAKVYKDTVKLAQRQIKGQLRKIEKSLEAGMRNLDHQYDLGSVFKSPKLNAVNKLKNNFLKGFESLKVEDFEKYVETLKKDMHSQRNAVIAHANTIYGADVFQQRTEQNGVESFAKTDAPQMDAGAYKGQRNGFIGKIGEILRNADADKQEWEKIEAQCQQARAAYNQNVAKANEALKKQKEELAKQQSDRKIRCEAYSKGNLKDATVFLMMSGHPNAKKIQEELVLIANGGVETEEANSLSELDADLRADSLRDFCKSKDCGEGLENLYSAEPEIFRTCKDSNVYAEKLASSICKRSDGSYEYNVSGSCPDASVDIGSAVFQDIFSKKIEGLQSYHATVIKTLGCTPKEFTNTKSPNFIYDADSDKTKIEEYEKLALNKNMSVTGENGASWVSPPQCETILADNVNRKGQGALDGVKSILGDAAPLLNQIARDN